MPTKLRAVPSDDPGCVRWCCIEHAGKLHDQRNDHGLRKRNKNAGGSEHRNDSCRPRSRGRFHHLCTVHEMCMMHIRRSVMLMSEIEGTSVNADGSETPNNEAANSAEIPTVVAAIEYETLAFARHVAAVLGRTRHDEPLLDGSAYTLLSLISAGGPASIGDLSAITGLDASTLNRQTAALIERGLVVRTANPDGSMARIFVMTDEGAQALATERRHSHAALSRTISAWNENEREELRRVLRRFNEAIEQNYERPWPREDFAGNELGRTV